MTPSYSPSWVEARRRLPRALAWLENGFARGNHVGAQLFVRLDDDPILASTGWAAPGVAMTDDALVNPLCGAKPVVAAAVARAVDHKLISPGAPVSRYVSGLCGTPFEHVTFADCLSHPVASVDTAAHPDLADPEAPLPPVIRRVLDDVALEPDNRTSGYVSWPFGLVAAALEEVFGAPFEAVLRQEVFVPVGMADTWVGMPEAGAVRYAAAGRLVRLFDCRAGEPRVAVGQDSSWRMERGWGLPTEGLRTPTREMGRFYSAVLAARQGTGDGWLSVAAAWMMTTRHQVGVADRQSGAKLDHGLGVLLESRHYDRLSTTFGPDCAPSSFGHGGLSCFHGFCDPDRGLVVSVFINGWIGDMAHARRMLVFTQRLYADLELS